MAIDTLWFLLIKRIFMQASEQRPKIAIFVDIQNIYYTTYRYNVTVTY